METRKQNRKERQAAETESRIVKVASEVFAEAGFAGARMDEIARRANVNKATIYYHIGNKASLYTRVLHEVFGDTAAMIHANVQERDTPEERLKTYISSIVRTVDRHPYIPPIMLREMAAGGYNLPEIVIRDISKIFFLLWRILEEGVREKVFIKTFPPFIHFMTVGAVVFSRNMETIREIFAGMPEMENLESSIPKDPFDEISRLLLRAVRRR